MNGPKLFPWRLFSRLVAMQTLIVLFALGASGIAARYLFKHQFLAEVEDQLRISISGLARNLPSNVTEEWCGINSTNPNLRLTVMSIQGQVLCDSHHDLKVMENHFSRPEVQTSLTQDFGQSIRFSTTLNEEMFYGAQTFRDRGLIVRGAIPLSKLNSGLRVFDTAIVVLLILLGLLLTGFAIWFGKKLALPIGRLLKKAGLEESSGVGPYRELSQLESSLDSIRRDLEVKAESLSREREEQATLMSAISDAILAVDAEGLPLFYNSRFSVLFGKTPALRGDRTPLWELFQDPEILDSFSRTLTGNVQSVVSAVSLEQDTGQKFFSLSVSPLRKPKTGEVYGAVGIFHEVTELKRAEQIRIDFVANVSHELRTPLTAIKGYTDTLSQDIEEGRAVDPLIVDVIHRNTERLMELINDLLDLSWLESNVDELQKTAVGVEELTRRACAQVEGAVRSKNQTLEMEISTPTVWADTGRVEQVLINLLDNASKYSGNGGKIRLVWDKSPSTGDTLLKVIDTGPGIPTEHHQRLFERFYRVDKARSREIGGTGLGLAIVKHIMQRHGGTVHIESAIGKGSTFICAFPAH